MSFLTQGPEGEQVPYRVKNTNWKFLLIVVVLAVIAGAGIWIYTQMTEEGFETLQVDAPEKVIEDELANWLTYRNEEYKFEFKYPESFNKFESCKLKEEDNFIGLGSRFSVLISNTEGLSLSEYIVIEREKLLYEQTFPPIEEAWHEENIYVGDIKGIRVTWFHGSRYSQIIYLLKDNKIFKISWTAGPPCLDYYVGQGLLSEDEAQNELEVFEQIPSTFRFIKTTELEKTILEEVELPPREPFNGLPCTGLQAYKSGQSMAGLSINVPEGWKVNYFICRNQPSEVGGWEWAAIHLDFAPPGWQVPTNMGSDWWMGWGSIFMHVYDYQPDIETWITEYLSDYKDTYDVIRKDSLGGRPYFILESSVEEFWVPQHIILGTEYSYSYGTSQDGFFEDEKHNFSSILTEEIFPHISIR